MDVKDAQGRPADQLQARRDAGVHAGRLQHRRLPRRGPRQGRLPPVAVRLRPRRRPLPPHPRDERPAHQPRPPGREPAARKGHRQGAAHRRQAVRATATSYYQTLIRWLEAGAPQRPADRRHAGRRRGLPASGRARRQGRDAADDRPGQVLRRHRPRRDQPGPLPHATTTTPPKIDADGLVTAGERGEAFVMARFATFTVGVAGHRAAQGPASSTCPTEPENNYIDTLVNAKLKKLRIAPSRALHRRGVPPPRLPRHHRPAADARGVRPVHGRRPTPNKREQARRRAARPQGVRRAVGA